MFLTESYPLEGSPVLFVLPTHTQFPNNKVLQKDVNKGFACMIFFCRDYARDHKILKRNTYFKQIYFFLSVSPIIVFIVDCKKSDKIVFKFNI